jgi:ribosome-associated toxin RatA of RatAB toxin-antitoxin module
MYVKSVSRDTNLFEYLTNEWKFHPNPQMYERAHLNSMTDLQLKEIEKSCLVEFYVSFKFVNSLYNTFSEMFMDQIFKKMVSAFTDRAAVLYGKPSILPKPVKI